MQTSNVIELLFKMNPVFKGLGCVMKLILKGMFPVLLFLAAQSASYAQSGCDATASGNLDTDGDNVSDICDLDDDNDGILDTVEKICTSNEFSAGWFSNAPSGTKSQDGIWANAPSGPPVYPGSDTSIVASASDFTFGSGLTTLQNGTRWDISSVGEANFISAKNNNDFISYEFTTPSIAGGFPEAGVTVSKVGFADRNDLDPYLIAVEITDNSSSNTELLIEGINIPAVAGYQYLPFDNLDNPEFLLSPSTSYTLTVYLYGATDQTTLVTYDDFQFGACKLNDTDNDGIPDHLDIDSDDDYCPDSIEGASDFGAADINADTTLDLSVDDDGVPMGSGSPQGAGSSSNDAINACPVLTLEKVVAGGTASDTDWTLSATAAEANNVFIDLDTGSSIDPMSGVEGANEVTQVLVYPDTFTLAESGGPAEYLQTGLSCASPADTDPSDGLTLVTSESAVCTFTNTFSAPDMAVLKTVTTVLTDMPSVGDQIIYNVNVSNTGNVNIDDVNATDPGPSFNGVAGTGSLVILPQNIDLIPGADQDFTITYTVTQADIDNLAMAADTSQAIDNSASASGTPINGTLPPITESSVMTGITANPSLSVVKSVTAESFSSPVAANDTVSYEFVVTNNGNVDISGVVPVDDGVEIDGAAGTGSLSAFSPASADLAPGENQTFTATYTLSAGDAAAIASSADPENAISNVASANGTPVSGTLPPVTPTPPVTAGPEADPSLSVTKSSTGQSLSSPLAAGDTVDYEFEVTNDGNVDINGAVPVDSGVEIDGSAGTGSLSAFSPTDADLVPGASQTFTATYTLSAADAAAIAAAADPSNAISNAATADGTPTSGTLPPVTETPPVTSGPTAAPDMTVLKTVTTVLTDMPSVGDQIIYNVNVSNTGNVNIDDVNATDSGPTFNNVAGTGSLVITPQNIDLVPGADQDFTITYTVTQADIDNLAMAADTSQAIDNSASASGTPTSGTLPTITPSSVMTGIAAGPSLSVVKSVTAESFSSPVAANDTVSYEFVVTNNGNVDISGVVPVDDGVEIDGSAGTGSLSAFSPASADLAPGENQTFTATYTLSAGDAAAIASSADPENAISNVASANGTPVSGTLPPVTPTPPVTAGPEADPSLSVTKSSTGQNLSSPLSAGDTVDYEFVVTNDGNVDINGAVPVDSGVEIDGSAGTGSLSAFSPTDADLVPGASQTFTATYTLSAGDAAAIAGSSDPENAISNAATADGTPTSGTLPPVTETPPVTSGPTSAPDMTVLKTVTTVLTDMPSVGDQIIYNVNVSNTGNVNIDDVNATDSGPTFNNVAGTGSLVITPQNIDLVPGADQDFTITYTVTQADIDNLAMAADTSQAIDNSASASGTPTSGTLPTITPSSVMTGIAAGPSLSVVKSVTAESFSSPVAANDTVSYEFVVTNNGNVDISGVVPVDDGVEIDGAAGTGSLSAFSPASADLAPGENQTFTATYTLSTGDAAAIASSADPENAISNVASANGTPVSGTLPPVTPTPPVTAGPAADPSLSVTKSSTGQSLSSPLAAGDTVDYEFVVTNDGNVDINGAVPVDSGVEIDGSAGTGSLSAFSPTDADLVPGASQTFTATYTLSAADAAAIAAAADPSNAISNAATADGTPTSGTLPPVTETPPVTTGPTSAPDMTVLKTVTTVLTDMPSVGDQIIYNVNVSNTGNVNIDDVNATDSGPTFNNVAGTGSLVITPQNIDLVPGADQDFTITYTVTQADIDNLAMAADTSQAIDNSASASGTPTSGTLPTITPSSVMTGIAAGPSLSVVKSVTAESFSSPVAANDTVSYEFVVTNNGNVDISGVVPVDDGVEIDGAAGTGSLSAFSPASADLAPGENQTFTATYTLSAGDAAAIASSADPENAISNVASANGTPVSGTLPPVTPTPPVTAGPAADPSLSVTKSSTGQSLSSPLSAGDTVDYEFVVTNDGNVDINGAVPVDSGVEIDGSAGTGSLSAFSPTDADLVPGASQTFTATYTLSAADAAAIAAAADPSNAISNAATADGTPTSGTLPPVTETPPVTTGPTSAPDMTVLKTVTTVLTDMPSVGDQIIYNVNVSNTGNVNIDDVNATDSGPTFNNVAGTGSLVITPQNIDLVPGADQDFTITYTVTQADIDNLAMAADTSQAIDNSASASGTPTSGTLPTITPSSVMTGIAAGPSLSVVKSVTAESFSSPVAANDTVSYEFVVTNNGNVDISGVVPVDDGVEIDGSAGTGSLSAFSPASADLAPGENQTFTATYTLSAGDAAAIASSADPENAISNVASANGTPVSGTLPPVTPTPPVTAGPEADPSLSVTKSSTGQNLSSPLSAGDTVDYEFVVTNDGNVDINGAVPVDSGVEIDGSAGTGSLSAFSPTDADLVPGASQTFTATYTLSAGDAAAIAGSSDPENAISNAATADGTPTSGTLPPVTETPPVTSGPTSAPDMTVLKTVTTVLTDMPSVGDQIIYNVNVSNTGNVNIDDVNATDSGPTFNNVAGTGSLVITPQNIDLIPGADQDFTITYTVTQADIDNLAMAADTSQAIDNSASASGTPTSGTLPTITPSSVMTGIAAGPSLSVVKSVTAESFSSPVAANDTVSYEFVVTNNGNVDISGVVPVDDGVEIDGAAGTGSLSAFSPASADLAPGENQTFTATYTLSAGDAAAIASSADPENAISNVASANGTPVSGTLPPVTPTPPVTAGPAADPSLSVTKSSTGQSLSSPLAAGDTVDYEFVVTNDGNVDINGAVPVDSGVEIDGSAGTGSLSAFSPSDADLVPGASQTFTATYTLSAADAAAIAGSSDPENAISNAATADGTPTSGTLPPVTETPPVTTGPTSAPDMAVLKTVTTVLTDMPSVGDQIIYNVNVSNTGNVNIDDVNATDSGPTFNNVAGTGSLVITPQNIDLVPGADQDFTITYTVTQADIDNLAMAADTSQAIDNSASASGTPTSGTLPTITPSSVMTGIAAGPSLSVVKSVTAESFSSPVAANDTVSYEFVVTNNGNVDISGVVPVDDGVEIDGAAGTGSLSAFSPASADLAPGENQTFTATYTLSAGDAAAIASSADPENAISNVASANGTPVSGTLPPVTPTPPVTAGPEADPSLSVTKSSTGQNLSSPLSAGDTVDYEFVVTNDGNVDINGAVPVDSGVEIDGSAGTGSLSAFSPSDADLVPGASQTFTATYTLSAADAAAIAGSSDPENAISNAATADGTPTSGTLPPVTETPPVTSGPTSAPDMAVLKTVTTVLTDMPSVGDQIIYNVNVSNTGNVNIDDVNATDSGPSFNSVAGTGSLVITPQNIDLVPGADQDFTITYAVTQADIDNLAMAADTSQAIDNSASASGTPTSGTLPTITPSSVMTGITAGPEIGSVKSATVGSIKGDGTVDVTYSIEVANTGNVTITPLTLVDDLTLPTQMGTAFNGVVSQPTIMLNNASGHAIAPSANASYDGTNELISGVNGSLDPGDHFTVEFTVNVNPLADNAPSVLGNTATAGGGTLGAFGPVTDDTNAGTDSSGDSTGEEPTDNPGGPGTATEITSPELNPSLILSKTLDRAPVDLGNGVFRVTFNMTVVNDGNLDFTNLQIEDDLNAMINTPQANQAAVSNASVSYVSGTVLSPSTSYNGTGDNNLLQGVDVFPVGASSVISLAFDFTPDQYFGPFNNIAITRGVDPAGETEEDYSESGQTPVSTNGGGDFQSPTPFSLNVPSTPVTLGWFKSELNADNSVSLTWETATEVANAGFYLYALSTSVDSAGKEIQQWLLINSQMISSKGDSTLAQAYSLSTDVVAQAYMLVDVSVMGKEVEHGPFPMGQEHGKRALSKPIDWESVIEEREAKKMQREEQRKNELERTMQDLLSSVRQLGERVLVGVLTAIIPEAHAVELLSFEVETAGVYQLTHADLKESGLDLSNMEVERIGLKEGGVLWPILLQTNGSATFTEESTLIFPARGLDSLYSGVNKYTLVIDEGQELVQIDARALSSSVAFAASYLGEKVYAPQNTYTFLSPESDDLWYADALNAIHEPVSKTVTLIVDDYAPSISGGFGSQLQTQPSQDPELSVTVWGGSALPGNGVTNPDHRVEIEVEDELAAVLRFDGLESESTAIPLAGINNGVNRIKITVPESEDYAYDLIRLDEVKLKYPRRFVADNDGLVFESDWSKFYVRGLSTAEALVLRLDNDGKAYLMSERGQASATDRIYFAGSDIGVSSTYFVATNASMRSPSVSIAVSSQNLNTDQAAYLVIAHADFIGTTNQALEGYVAELEAKYGSADLVDVEEIYAAHSGGVVDAMAIKDYIADAYTNRGTRHVLLVGGDNFDYRDFSGQGAQSFIPSIYVPIASNVNAVPSDSSYVLIDDDLVPDLSIARLPVRNTQDLLDLLAKRSVYLGRSSSDEVLIAADEMDQSNYSFRNDALRLVFDHFSDLEVNEVYLDDTDRESARTSITQSFNAGVNLVGYFGHSSTDRWAIDTIFTGDDAAALNNYATPSVVTQWGCWNTFYASPDNESMADRFLLSGQQGAVTVMGASSFTQAVAERRMAGYLFANLRNGMSIGEAVRDAKASIAQETPHQVDVLLGWAVLGFDDMVVFQ